MNRDQVVSFFDSYINHFDPPIKYDIYVNSVVKHRNGFLVETDRGSFTAKNVVIAVGFYQKARLPLFTEHLSSHLFQIHSSHYRNSAELPPGGVLVIGSAQSGSQIAEELLFAGKDVFLSVSATDRIPRRYRGLDSYRWMDLMGYFKRTVEELKSPSEKYASSAHATGKNGGHTINLHQFSQCGMHLLGHIEGVHTDRIFIAPDLQENLAKADQFESDFVAEVDQYIKENRLDNPPELLPKLTDGFHNDEVREIKLRKTGINNIIWATGYRFDFSWVNFPVFDQDGFPIQDRGITDVNGLYFIGLPFLHTGISGVIAGVGDDAEYIALDIFQKEQAKNNTCSKL